MLRGRMLAGTTFSKNDLSRRKFLSAPRFFAGECGREYMVPRVSILAPDLIKIGLGNSRHSLSPVRRCLRRMQEELHVICGFPVQVRVAPLRAR